MQNKVSCSVCDYPFASPYPMCNGEPMCVRCMPKDNLLSVNHRKVGYHSGESPSLEEYEAWLDAAEERAAMEAKYCANTGNPTREYFQARKDARMLCYIIAAVAILVLAAM